MSLHWSGTAWKLVTVPGTGVLSGVVAIHGGGTTAVGTNATKALIVETGKVACLPAGGCDTRRYVSLGWAV